MNDEHAPMGLGVRLRQIRLELFGDHGASSLAERLGIAPEAWIRYEEFGEPTPCQLLLRFIELTGADPLWLLQGIGPMYRSQHRRMERDPTENDP